MKGNLLLLFHPGYCGGEKRDDIKKIYGTRGSSSDPQVSSRSSHALILVHGARPHEDGIASLLPMYRQD